MSSQSHYPPRTTSRAETPLPPPPTLRERGDSASSQPASTTSSANVNNIQIPTILSSNARSSPQKAQLRTYDSKLISREMDRLAMQTPTPSLHGHTHSHSHAGSSYQLHGHGMTTAGSSSTLTLVPSMSHSGGSTLASGSSTTINQDDPWSALHLFVLPIFNGEVLRVPIEDLNALVKRHLHTVVSKAPSRAINTLENDLEELLGVGMVTLNARLKGVDDDKLLNRVVELWGFFWTQVLPYVEGAFLPLQMDQLLVSLSRTPKAFRSTSPVESTDRDEPSAPPSTLTAVPIDVRLLTLRTFRDAILLPIFERLHMLVAFSSGVEPRKEFNQPRFQQMLLVLNSIQPPSVVLSMNEPPLSPGEHAITHLLRAARNPSAGTFALNVYGSPSRRRTLGPSSFSGGAPRDRRGRIATKNPVVDDPSLDPDETPTVNGQSGFLAAEDPNLQRLREERQFLASLRSPDVDAAAANGGNNGRFANVSYDFDSAEEKSEDDESEDEEVKPTI